MVTFGELLFLYQPRKGASVGAVLELPLADETSDLVEGAIKMTGSVQGFEGSQRSLGLSPYFEGKGIIFFGGDDHTGNASFLSHHDAEGAVVRFSRVGSPEGLGEGSRAGKGKSSLGFSSCIGGFKPRKGASPLIPEAPVSHEPSRFVESSLEKVDFLRILEKIDAVGGYLPLNLRGATVVLGGKEGSSNCSLGGVDKEGTVIRCTDEGSSKESFSSPSLGGGSQKHGQHKNPCEKEELSVIPEHGVSLLEFL